MHGYYPPPWWGGFPSGGQAPASPDVMEKAFKIMERLSRKEEKKKRKEDDDKKKKEDDKKKPKTYTTGEMLALMTLMGPWIGFAYVYALKHMVAAILH